MGGGGGVVFEGTCERGMERSSKIKKTHKKTSEVHPAEAFSILWHQKEDPNRDPNKGTPDSEKLNKPSNPRHTFTWRWVSRSSPVGL